MEPQGLLFLFAALFLRFAFFGRAALQGRKFGFGACAQGVALGAGRREDAQIFLSGGFLCRKPPGFAPLQDADGCKGCGKRPEEDQGDDKGRIHTHEGSK